jgi:S-adenosylmethionine:tRNA ribosyltransferase-isomerase
MRVDAFSYELPPELVAQHPAKDREGARLLCLPRGDGPLEHRGIGDLPGLLPPGTLVVVNDTRVIPARLLGHKKTGGRAELLLARRVGRRELDAGRDGPAAPVDLWHALGRANKPLRTGMEIEFKPRGAPAGPPVLLARLLGRSNDDGLFEVALWTPSGGSVDEAVRACGQVPLPPYIKRHDGVEAEDAARYQTVYARHDGAVAAPTAGLHLTEALIERMKAAGAEVATVTLHVGPGTFLPVEVDDLDLHTMHAERCVVPPSTREAIARARARGAAVLAVGTTTVRALESAADARCPGQVVEYDGDTRLLIQPGYSWRVVDALLTNFHLPRSTLIALVCAFGGTERALAAYAAAVGQRYRFFSYGDAMLLWRRR